MFLNISEHLTTMYMVHKPRGRSSIELQFLYILEEVQPKCWNYFCHQYKCLRKQQQEESRTSQTFLQQEVHTSDDMAIFELLNDKKHKYLQYKFSMSACISGVTVAIA